ncbi:MAG: Trm112 family protein [Acidimicrobiia bacterium]|nr:Trm112 family protein [Acidimicrobiia bacterium]
MAVHEDLLAIMACVECRGGLVDEGDSLRCAECGLRYPVRDGIPVMLLEEAERPGADS